MPKKFRGRFTVIDESNKELLYGQEKVVTNIDGVDLLKEGENVTMNRLLTEEDFRKIKLKKLKDAVRKVDRHGFRSDSESEDEENMSEEGEEELSENKETEQNGDAVPDIRSLKGKARKEAIKKLLA